MRKLVERQKYEEKIDFIENKHIEIDQKLQKNEDDISLAEIK